MPGESCPATFVLSIFFFLKKHPCLLFSYDFWHSLLFPKQDMHNTEPNLASFNISEQIELEGNAQRLTSWMLLIMVRVDILKQIDHISM